VAVVAEINELKLVSNAKVSPATTTSDYFFQGPKLVVPDRELRDSNSNSLRDDCSETFEMGFRDTTSVVGNGERKGSSKKSRRWSKVWNIWGLINWRGANNKDEDEDQRFSRPNGVERGWVRGLAVRVWDRKRVGGGREREKNKFLKVKKYYFNDIGNC
jgi:hypothetical protein